MGYFQLLNRIAYHLRFEAKGLATPIDLIKFGFIFQLYHRAEGLPCFTTLSPVRHLPLTATFPSLAQNYVFVILRSLW